MALDKKVLENVKAILKKLEADCAKKGIAFAAIVQKQVTKKGTGAFIKYNSVLETIKANSRIYNFFEAAQIVSSTRDGARSPTFFDDDTIKDTLLNVENLCKQHHIPFVAVIQKSKSALIKYSSLDMLHDPRLNVAWKALEKSEKPDKATVPSQPKEKKVVPAVVASPLPAPAPVQENHTLEKTEYSTPALSKAAKTQKDVKDILRELVKACEQCHYPMVAAVKENNKTYKFAAAIDVAVAQSHKNIAAGKKENYAWYFLNAYENLFNKDAPRKANPADSINKNDIDNILCEFANFIENKDIDAVIAILVGDNIELDSYSKGVIAQPHTGKFEDLYNNLTENDDDDDADELYNFDDEDLEDDEPYDDEDLECADEDMEDEKENFTSNNSINVSKKNTGTIMDKVTTLARAAVETAKVEGTEALWRTAALQSVKTVREPLLAALKKNNVSDTALAAVGGFLDTEIGLAVLAMALGTLLQNVPTVGNNAKVVRVCSEMRILGLSVLSNLLADVMLNPMRDFVSGLVEGLPDDPPDPGPTQ